MKSFLLIVLIKLSLQFFYTPKAKVFEDASLEEVNHGKEEDNLKHLDFLIQNNGNKFNQKPQSYIQLQEQVKLTQNIDENKYKLITIQECQSDCTFSGNSQCQNYFSNKRFDRAFETPVQLTFNIDEIRRISYIWIHWKLAPEEFNFYVSQNGKSWELIQNFDNKNQQYQFPQLITFDKPQYFKYGRLEMKKPKKFFTFGIESIQLWTKSYTVMIKSSSNVDDMCLINQQNVQSEIFAMKCMDAISLSDQREIFNIEMNFQIKSYNQLCLLNQKQSLVIDQCIYGNNNDKWIFDQQGRILSGITQQCLTLMPKKQNLDILDVVASSELDDLQHSPLKAVDSNSETYWATQERKAQFQINFQTQQTISEIFIKWKYIPKAFEVDYQVQNIWKTIKYSTDNVQQNLQIKFLPKIIQALKIKLTENDPVYGVFQGKQIYGISEIQLKRDYHQIQLVDCSDGENDNTNKWALEDVEFVDDQIKNQLQREQVDQFQTTNTLLELLQRLVKMPKSILKLIENQKNCQMKIIQIKKELEAQEAQFSIFQQNFQVKKSQIGSSISNPISQCWKIAKLFKNKKNGYYWIQPECCTKPYRVYCDLSQKQDFFYLPNEDNRNFTSIQDIQQFCADKGFYPAEVFNEEQINTIIYYINDIQVDLMSASVIPLGYDYTCKQGWCQGIFQSFSSSSSLQISNKLKQILDPYNILNQAFSWKDKTINSIGLGLSKNQTFYFELESYKIKGILCSTNQRSSHNSNILNIDCFTNPRGNYNFDGQFLNVKVLCPANCLNTPAQIWGYQTYKDDSSICKAAIHSGELTNEGGEVQVQLLEGKQNYQSYKNYEIESLYYDRWERSFEVKKIKQPCPNEKLNFKERIMDNQRSFFEQDFNLVSQFSEKLPGNNQKDPNCKSDQKTNIQSSSNQQVQKFKDTQILIVDEEEHAKTQKLTTDTRILQQNIMKLQQPLNNNNFQKEIENYKINIKNIQEISQQLISKAKNYLQNTLSNFQQKTLKKLELMKYQNYEEKYIFDIQDTWNIFDSGSRSDWKFSFLNLLSHQRQLSQQNILQSYSYITLKFKDFYDYQFRFSLYLQDDVTIQILIRYQDNFNYYAVELTQQTQKFIKIRNGITTVIKELKNSIQLNRWTNFEITAQNSVFIMKMGYETSDLTKKFEGMSSIFQIEDHDICKGYSGFASNNVFFVDDISLIALNCQINEVKVNYQNILAPQCNRYKESFYGSINTQWEIMNKQQSWSLQKNMLNRQNVIYQENQSLENNQITLKNKMCDQGEFSFDFVGLNDGIVSALFNYENQKKFYLLEFSSNFIRLRKIFEDYETNLAYKQQIGYIVNQWYKVKISINKNKFTIFHGKINEIPQNVFEQDIMDNINIIQDGTVGFQTHNTKAAFDAISLKPIQSEEQIYQKPIMKSDINDVSFQFDQCIKSKTPESKTTYCTREFPDQTSLMNCQNNFCEVCCDKSISWTQQTKKHGCVRKCKENSNPSDNENIWRQCVEVQIPSQTLYKYCEDKFQKNNQADCKTDLCNLCCITISQQKNTNVSNQSVFNCKKKCLEIFQNQKLSVIL